MSRLYQFGFELNTTVAQSEYGGLSSSNAGVTISTAQAHSGTYSWHSAAGAIGDALYTYQVPFAGPLFVRKWFFFTAYPTTTNRHIMKIINVGVADCAVLRMSTTGAVGLFDNTTTQVGSYSRVIPKNTWVYLEVKYFNNTNTGFAEMEARLNGSVFASTTTNTNVGNCTGTAWGQVIADTTLDFYVDDCAGNDSTGTTQNDYPGPGSVYYQLPNGAGDNNQWTTQVGGTAGAANNFTRVNGIPPDDSTSYNADTVLNQTDDYALAPSVAGLKSTDIINAVQVNVRYAGATTTNVASFVVRLKKTSGGTVFEGTPITPALTAWWTNTEAIPQIPTITLYKDPDGLPWTKQSLDSAQIGARISTGNTNAAQITEIWLTVDTTPASNKLYIKPLRPHAFSPGIAR